MADPSSISGAKLGDAPSSTSAGALALLEQRYRQHLVDQFSRLTFKGASPTANAVSLPLSALYVELKAIADVPESADTFSVEERQSIGKMREVGDSDPFLRPLDTLHSERWRHQPRDDEARDERRSSGEHRPVALASLTRPGLVLLGEPGSGKTTLLQYLALMAACRSVPSPGQLGLAASVLGYNSEDCRLPIFVPLAAYDDHLRREQLEAGLHDFLALYYERRRGLPGLEPLFQAALASGRALVLLDGLDEVIDRSTRDFVTQQVAALIRQHGQHGGQGNRFLVTSRVAGYRELPLPSDIPHATVLDFGPAEIAQFAQKWCLAYEIFVHGGVSEPATISAAAEERALLEDLRTTPSVAALATNPLLLTMLALLRRQVGKLPHRRVELYERYLDALLRSRVELRSPGRGPKVRAAMTRIRRRWCSSSCRCGCTRTAPAAPPAASSCSRRWRRSTCRSKGWPRVKRRPSSATRRWPVGRRPSAGKSSASRCTIRAGASRCSCVPAGSACNSGAPPKWMRWRARSSMRRASMKSFCTATCFSPRRCAWTT